jgi:hypothetical protein
MTMEIKRRTLLRGAMGGAAVTVGLPLFDRFLNLNGTALASGGPLPIAFGHWFQHLGFNPGRWVPDTVGPNYENKVELKVFDPLKHKINIISGHNYFLDGRPDATHRTGGEIGSVGEIIVNSSPPASLDQLIAETIGKTTRFRSIEVAVNGSRSSYSRNRGSAATNPSEPDPVALYTRIFGPSFQDPNAAEFKPDPAVMAKRSVLSYVSEQRADVVNQLGYADRQRLDEYFTSLRQIEQQLAIQLEKPAPIPACSIPEAIEESQTSTLIDDVIRNSKIFGGLLAHAVACDQTRVFSVMVGSQGHRRPGLSQNWHSLSHEEAIHEELGYQPEMTVFIDAANLAFYEFLKQLDSLNEGIGTVLDRTLVLWQTDHGFARTHSTDNLPILTAGGAGGRVKTGIHVRGNGGPITRGGLTAMQAMGVRLGDWGGQSNHTNRPITEILA